MSETGTRIAPTDPSNHSETDKKRQKFAGSPNPKASPAISGGTQKGKLVEVVKGADAIDARLRAISSEAAKEVAAFVTGGPLTTEQVQTARDRNRDMYDRGIRSRTIYLESVRNDKLTIAQVHWLNERGSQVRTVPSLPIQMVIADQKTAILPLDPTGKAAGIRIYRDPSVVIGLQALFEQTWLSATPLGLTLSTKSAEFTATQRAVLEMLALGYIDREIEEKMLVDKRTIGRRVAEIMHILNTKTRFQAGVRAVKQGLI